MRLTALLATVLAVALAGCGDAGTDTGFAGEEAAVARALGDLADDGRQGDAARICERDFSRELREAVAETGSSCPQEIEKALDDADGFELDVTDVQVDGDSATAEVTATDGGEEVTRTFELVREDGEWRVSGFGGA